MELVLLTFGLLFAICRLGVRGASDRAGSYGIARYGDLKTVTERHGDKLMEEAIELMVCDEVLFDDVWGKIERSRSEYSSELANAPARENLIWDRLLTGGRRPVSAYSYEFRKERKFKSEGHYYRDSELTMTDSVNHRRAVHCLMWLQGKEVDCEISTLHISLVNPGYEVGHDNLSEFDEVDWQRRHG